MESQIKQISRSMYAVIGPEGSTNFGIVKGSDGSGALIDADIRRIDEIEEALQLTGSERVLEIGTGTGSFWLPCAMWISSVSKS